MRLPNVIAACLLLVSSAAEASYVELPVWRGLWIDSAASLSGHQRQQMQAGATWLGHRLTHNDGGIMINLGRRQGIRLQLNAGAATAANLTDKPHRSAITLRAPTVQAVITATASVVNLQRLNTEGSKIQDEPKRAFVPEPGSLAMVLLGIGALLRRRA